MYIVFVSSACGTETGVHILCNRIYGVYAYLPRENGIQFVNSMQLVLDWAFVIEVGNVVSGIYAGIGPPRANNLNGLAEQCGKGCLEFRLYTVGILLNLPAAESRTVVGQTDEISHKNCKFAGCKSWAALLWSRLNRDKISDLEQYYKN